MDQVIQQMLVKLLQGNARSGKYLQYPNLYITQPLNFNDLLLKTIENGLLDELNNLYELLRDITMFQLYLKTYRPFLGLT